ncbi:hypothetical protein H9K75_14580 [Diaphorobacter aerolatus]|uniref:Type IV pilin accessory protein n=1 Tax=Diaphorobacter aerolatus TaxID=1288495 RepID=A0A7H0GGS3_9BURK|nr:hypothetical protein H9K75_14580 [Diaphorobacter aerolatus]
MGSLLGAQYLFKVLIIVIFISGPLLTAILSNPSKKRREQWLDWLLIGGIQSLALCFGLYGIGLTRPVAVVFEVDRFVVVSIGDIYQSSSSKTEKSFASNSWAGPVWLGVREPRSSDERLENIELSINGIEPSLRPDWWQNLEKSTTAMRRRAQSLKYIVPTLDSESQNMIREAVAQTNTKIDELSFLPLVSRKNLDSWVVLIDAQTKIVGYAPISGFRDK